MLLQPFNPLTTIRWEMDTGRHVSLKVYDLLGREIVTLVNDSYPAGVHTATFDASTLSSGVYIYQLQTGNIILNRKMTVVK